MMENMGGTIQLPFVIKARHGSGNVLGMLSMKPPPVIWTMPFIAKFLEIFSIVFT